VTTRIRPFRPGDEPHLAAIVGRVYAEYGMRFDQGGFDRDLNEVERRYPPPGAGLLVAEDGAGRVRGLVGVDRPEPPDVAEVHRLYVDPDARGQGLGARLLEAAEAFALRLGAREMRLFSDVRFPHAHFLYARAGYRVVSQRTLPDLDGSVELGFRRSLQGPRAPVRPSLLGARAVPLSEVLEDRDLAHAAAMVAAGIIDSRALVRAGRGTPDGGHDLPRPTEVFGPPAPETQEVSALIVPMEEGDVLAGFEREGTRRLHPVFEERNV